MENGGRKPWQPIWIPVALIAVIGVSAFVFMAPPELQKGFLPGAETDPAASLTLLDFKTSPCDSAVLQDEICQAFDLRLKIPAERYQKLSKILLKTTHEGGVLGEIDPDLLEKTSSSKFQVKKIHEDCGAGICRASYAFRLFTPLGSEIRAVDFVFQDGSSVSVQL